MLTRSSRFFAGAFALFLIVTPAALADDDPLEGFDAYVAGAVEDWGAPGLAIAVVKDDQVVFARGFGLLELGKPDPVNADTLFHVGSTTKAFVTMSFAMLVEDGLLAWEDKVIDHLPGFRVADAYVTRELTIRDLLDHGSGVETGDFLWLRGYERKETLRRMQFAPQAFSLRSDFQYNNLMFLVAGEVIAAVTGAPFEDFIRQRIFDPLGMDRTTIYAREFAARDNRSTAHYPDDGDMMPIEYPAIYEAGGAGLINSSVADYTNWLRFLLRGGELDGEQLVSELNFDELFTAQNAMRGPSYPAAQMADSHLFAYGLGWFLQDYKGEKLVMHTGSIQGQAAIVGLLPEENLGVVVFINGDHVEVRHALMYDVFDRYLGARDRDWSADLLAVFDDIAARRAEAREAAQADRVTGTQPSLALAQYVGRYENDYMGDLEVELADGGLSLTAAPRLHLKLEHWQYDRFRGTSDNLWLSGLFFEFSPDSAGGIASVRFAGDDQVFTRVDPDSSE